MIGASDWYVFESPIFFTIVILFLRENDNDKDSHLTKYSQFIYV